MYFIYMKRLLFISSLLIIALAPVSCFYIDEAETVDPGDEAFTNPTPPVGGVTNLTVTSISAPTIASPVIKITFNIPITQASVTYGTTIIVEVEDDLGNPVVGHSLAPVSDPTSSLNINLPALLTDYVISVTLDNIVSDADSAVILPYTFNQWTIP